MEEDGFRPGALEAFWEATRELDHAYSLCAKACGLSDAAYWALVWIQEGLTTQSQISDQLSISRQTLHSAFRQLRDKGLIRLETLADNQRSKQAVLTDAGRRFVEKHVVRLYRIEERVWSGFAEEERRALTTLTLRYARGVRRLLEEPAGEDTI